MVAQIIPLKKIPRHLDWFDYQIPKNLLTKVRPGCIVKIPWRSQVIFGLVKNVTKQTHKKDIKLKKIISLVWPKPLVTPSQIELIDKLAANFYLAPSLWWKMILPQVPSKKASFKPWLSENKLGKNKLPASVIPPRSANKLQLIMLDNFNDMVTVAVKLLKSKGVNMLLCPEISQLELIISFLPKNYIKKIAIFHKQQAKTEYWQNYLKVINNEAKLIIGTRLTVLAPVNKLERIIVFKSDDYSFKQADQNPRFWIHDVIYNLQKIFNSKIYFLSLAPRISNYAYVKNQRGLIVNKQQPLNVQLVDLGKEFQINNYTYISWQLEQSINKTLDQQQKIFLLVNRKGLARKLICKDCGWTARCQDCQRLLSVKENGKLYCHLCLKFKPVPGRCINCQGTNLTNQGVTNQYIYGQIKKIWPKVKAQYIDINNPKIAKNSAIIVGTRFAINQLDRARLGLVAFITADQEITQADYQASEYGWQLFSYLARLNKNLSIILQTWQPDYYVYKYFILADYEKFWRYEMNLRKKYNYPPYSKFIKCMVSDSKQTAAKNKALDLYNYLHKNLPSTVNVTPPLPVSSIKINNKFVFFVLIRYTGEDLSTQLGNLPADIILDFNPYNVF